MARSGRRASLHQSGVRPPPYAIEGGYVATVNFSCMVTDLEAIEGTLTGVVSSGANRLTAIEFLTSKLQAARIEARRRAVQVAKANANLYCEALGARLGEAVNISERDLMPRTVRRNMVRRRWLMPTAMKNVFTQWYAGRSNGKPAVQPSLVTALRRFV